VRGIPYVDAADLTEAMDKEDANDCRGESIRVALWERSLKQRKEIVANKGDQRRTTEERSKAGAKGGIDAM